MKYASYVYFAAGAVFAGSALMLFLPAQPAAIAQIPDQGAQMATLIDEVKGTNARIDKLAALLEGGKVQVKITNIRDMKDDRAK